MSVPTREPKKSSDKYNNGVAFATSPEEFDYSKKNADGQTNAQPGAKNSNTSAKTPEYKTVNRPQPYLITGAVVALAAAIWGISNVGSVLLLALLGLITFSISKSIFKPKRYKVPVQHKLALTGFAETDDILKKADETLKSIRTSAEKISEKDPEYAETLDGLIEDAYRIVDFTAENCAQVTQLRRFFNYYLPTLEKLSKTYVSLQKGGEGEQVTQTKEEIVTATEAMKGLFEKQFDKLYQNTAMDISTDVDVLESMLESDGIKATMGGH